MNVLSPIWLIGLAPWLALAVWMLRGRGDLRRVPFLPLWGESAGASKAAHKRKLPPLATMAVLGAMLLGVVAASRLALGGRQRVTVNLFVDRGTRMSAPGGAPRFKSRTDAFLDELQKRWPRSRVNLIPLPGEPQPDLSIDACRTAMGRMSITAVDTSDSLAGAVNAHRPNSIVISNQPGDTFTDIGVVSLALATQPHLQLMIRLQNFSAQTSVNLQIKTAGKTIEKVVPLPPPGGVGNGFIDLDRVGDVIVASLIENDDNPFNNHAYLISESEPRAPDPRVPLSEAQQRVIGVYQRARVRRSSPEKLPVVDQLETLGNTENGVIVPKLSDSVRRGPVKVATHPITAHVDWQSLPGTLKLADAPDGWTPLVSFGSQVVVAINPQHPRQVWVGIDSDAWVTTKDFVIFWTNVLDYAGGGNEIWAAHPMTEWTPEWKSAAGENGVEPGVYQRSDGARRAFNASEIPAQPVMQEPWQSQIDHLKPESTAGEIAPALLVAALGLIVIFAIRY